MRWGPFAKIYRENDTSAFKKRKVIKPDGSIDSIVLHPEFRQLLADLANGVMDGVIFYDLDRLVRQSRDLEDLIDIVEYVKRPVTGVTDGRVNLINEPRPPHDPNDVRDGTQVLRRRPPAASPANTSPPPSTEPPRAASPTAGAVGKRKGQLVPDETDVVVRSFQNFMSAESGRPT
ncbi:recombinase family protein [Streptomyces sp. NPDC101150]|uniref:recombinase family protein n=1 Tax=Streptomyces sp. NPDC101150 TaxID=3366114 RepID=UPI003811EDDF